MARIATLSCLLLAAAARLAGATAAAPPPPAPLAELLAAAGIQPVTPSMAAPDFRLPRLAGGEATLSGYHGKWVVLTFFATWCGPCRSEMPTLEELHRGLAADGVAVLAVSVDRSREPLASFVAELDLTLPVFWDRTGEVGGRYHAASIPLSYVIDPAGGVVGMARGARDWQATLPLFRQLAAALPGGPDPGFRYAADAPLELPEVLEPPTAEWSLPTIPPRPGRPFTLEVRMRWSGRLEDYLPQPPQLTLPEGVRRGAVAASSSSSDGEHLIRYSIELTADAAGVYELDPIELRYLPALGNGPVAARVAGPTLEVSAAGLGGATPAALAAAAAALVVLTSVWWWRRRRAAALAAPEPAPWVRLRAELDRARALRLAGETAAAYEILATAAGELEAAGERRDIERRLEAVRFGGSRPDRGELEAIERRLERALGVLRPDPDAESRRRLGLERPPAPSPITPKETSG